MNTFRNSLEAHRKPWCWADTAAAMASAPAMCSTRLALGSPRMGTTPKTGLQPAAPPAAIQPTAQRAAARMRCAWDEFWATLWTCTPSWGAKCPPASSWGTELRHGTLTTPTVKSLAAAGPPCSPFPPKALTLAIHATGQCMLACVCGSSRSGGCTVCREVQHPEALLHATDTRHPSHQHTTPASNPWPRCIITAPDPLAWLVLTAWMGKAEGIAAWVPKLHGEH